MTSADERKDQSHHWTVAILRMTTDRLRDAGATLERGVDDLDAFDLAELRDPKIGTIIFLRRDHSPSKGFDVMVNAAVQRAEALKALKRSLGVVGNDFEWRTEYERFPGVSPVVNLK